MEKYSDFEQRNLSLGLEVRIVKINDVNLNVFSDFRHRRINVEVYVPYLEIPDTMNMAEKQSYLHSLKDIGKNSFVVRSYTDANWPIAI